jgi:peptidoglycan hydrolase CwlO-like protein
MIHVKMKVEDIMIELNGEVVSLKSVLEEVLERTGTLETSVENAENDVNYLKEQVDYDLRYKVESLNDKLNDVESKIDDLESELDN